MSGVKVVLLAIDLETRKRDQASGVLKNAQQAHLFAQNQMSQLETYATETESRWVANAQNSTTPELMRHHYQFMDRLHYAINLQKGVLENSSRKVDAAKQLVLDVEFRLASLKQVLKKKNVEINALQNKREQKQMDEFAALSSGRATDRHFGGEPS